MVFLQPLLLLLALNCGAVQLPVQAQWWWWQQQEPPPQRGYYQPPPPQETPKRQTPRPHRRPPADTRPTPTPKPKQSTARKREQTEPAKSDHRRDSRESVDLDQAPEMAEGPVSSGNPYYKKEGGADPAPSDEPSTSTASKVKEVIEEPTSWSPPPGPPELPERDGKTVFIYNNSDSLNRVAKACKTTSEELLKANGLSWSTLRDGQALVVPIPEEPPSGFSPATQMRREVWRGVRGKKQIALTFDAGGEDDGVNDLLGGLREANAPASFFVTGDFARKNPGIMKEMSTGNFRLYNHSWSHPEFTKIADEKMQSELGKTDAVIQQITGKSTRPYWRPPFGDRDARVLSTTGDFGFQSIYWTLDTLDSVGDKKDPQFVINRVVNPPQAKGKPEEFLDGAIVLMHVGETGTARAVPEIIRELRRMGFTLVTVDEILKP